MRLYTIYSTATGSCGVSLDRLLSAGPWGNAYFASRMIQYWGAWHLFLTCIIIKLAKFPILKYLQLLGMTTFCTRHNIYEYIYREYNAVKWFLIVFALVLCNRMQLFTISIQNERQCSRNETLNQQSSGPDFVYKYKSNNLTYFICRILMQYIL